MKWIILRGNSRVVRPKHVFHIGYEPTYMFDLVGPKVSTLCMVIKRVYLLDSCRILGLQPLIPLLQYVNRLGFEICSVNRTRKLGYINLNWPRCSARVTESLALTDGSFCQKQNTLYFRLCKNCEFMMCILIVNHQFNHMHPWCSWECMLPGRCSPGKTCHTFWNRNIVLLPILLGKVNCVAKTTLCELYVVKFWEGLA